jgi:hypothetical protein
MLVIGDLSRDGINRIDYQVKKAGTATKIINYVRWVVR